MKTTVKVTEGHVTANCAVARKWDVEGVTKTQPDFERCFIEVVLGENHKPGIVKAVVGHEVGHASRNQDIRDGFETATEAFETLIEQDRWETEIEAWMRGERITTLQQGQCMLDCLNSYRRTLSISDRVWEYDRDALLETMAVEKHWEALKAYIPLEPDDDDEEPDCSEYGEVTDDEMDGGEDVDPDEGWEPSDDTFDLPPDETPTTRTTDKHWLDQTVIERIEQGDSIAEIAADYDLDMNEMPPLVKALINGRDR